MGRPGRPALNKDRITCRIEPDTLSHLVQIAYACGWTRSIRFQEGRETVDRPCYGEVIEALTARARGEESERTQRLQEGLQKLYSGKVTEITGVSYGGQNDANNGVS